MPGVEAPSVSSRPTRAAPGDVTGSLWQAFTGFGAMAFGPFGMSMTTAWLRQRIEREFPPIGTFLSVGGLDLHVVDLPGKDASAPTIVVLHGTASSLRDPLAALGADLEGRARVIFIDRPGHGYTADEAGAYAGLADQADLVAYLLDGLGIERAVLLGHSFGGSVAAAFTVQHPDRAAGAVLVAPATHPWDDGFAWSRGLMEAPVVGAFLTDTLATPLALSMLDSSVAQVFAPEPMPAGLVDATGAPLAVRPEAMRATNREVTTLNERLAALTPLYADIRVPVTVIAGDADHVVPIDQHARRFAALVPEARLVTLKGAGHMLHHTNTATVLDAVDDVLAKVTAKARPAAPVRRRRTSAAKTGSPTETGAPTDRSPSKG